MLQAPRGTQDIYGEDMKIWRCIEDHVRGITDAYNFTEIRVPIFEHTELFLRGVGDTTDIVQKEMYTFEDKGGRSLSLRPEQTAGTARAFVERGMFNKPQPTKLFYIGPNFRYERPQEGRYRQHYQFGVELFGAPGFAAEAEVISTGYELLTRLGVKDFAVCINSIGCPDCRKVYHENLKNFLGERMESLCGLCKQRFEKNPLRTLDCKTEGCKELLKSAPSVLDALDDECRAHFEGLKNLLTLMGIPFVVDAKIVRGLDYYTRTVFEFIKDGLTVIGGGRYDGLISQVGGPPTPGVGYGMGIERLVLLLQKQNAVPEVAAGPDIFIGNMGEDAFAKAQELVYTLRKSGISAESDLLNRSVKAQMKFASKINARFTLILGENELKENTANLKNMETGEAESVPLDELATRLKN
ncbi:MAG: histidine--tRNA ligase [Defluviitaleaceae bacterium]|nr:histidine--tRNA ligase [Defluviitaleaceae bacterium]MCL2264015.1 histidine--tRNA ligase [Defluviitaleaceae bacterium]